MAPTLILSIPTTTTSLTPKPHTLYTVSIRHSLRAFDLQKRYSDFEALHTALTSQCSNTPPPALLPQKSWFKSTVSSPTLTESRRQGLEAYLRAINEAEDARWRNSNAWKSFLNLPSEEGGSSANGVVGGATSRARADLQGPITDPTVWLDVHRDVKTQLRDARLHLTRRDQASTAQGQHEASADAKRCLVRAGTMVAALERGLQAMSGDTSGVVVGGKKRDEQSNEDAYSPPKLGDGEVRRRRDLLAAAKKERDGLDAVLSSFVMKTAAGGTDAAVATAGDKEGLFKVGTGNGHVQLGSSSRRVLGAPVKETQRTRELDNAGVLQLQKQIMQEQDSDLTDLTKVVARMKEMGVQIGEETNLQNEMLKMLDQDVERGGDKIAIAKKRIGKIT